MPPCLACQLYRAGQGHVGKVDVSSLLDDLGDTTLPGTQDGQNDLLAIGKQGSAFSVAVHDYPDKLSSILF
jgi:hypothetical protein